jgi:hypothetical protein
LIAVYNAEGLVSLNGPREIMAGYHPHPYRPNGADFTPERIADANVAKLQQHLAHYPTLTEYLVNGQSVSHPIAQYIYDNTLYLKPTDEFDVALSQINFQQNSAVVKSSYVSPLRAISAARSFSAYVPQSERPEPR